MELTLILLSGLPGCGKTTLARRLARRLTVPLLAKDRVQRVLRDDRDHVLDAPLTGYHLILDLAEEQLALGLSVVVDAVFPRAGFRGEATRIAARQGARFAPIVCVCSDEAVWRARMASRVEYVPDWSPVGWDEVERLRGEWEAWATPVLEVDAVEPVERNVARVVTYLGIDSRGEPASPARSS